MRILKILIADRRRCFVYEDKLLICKRFAESIYIHRCKKHKLPKKS